MAKDTPDKSGRTGPEKPPRKPVTIDLPAEEIVRKPIPASPPDEASDKPAGAASVGELATAPEDAAQTAAVEPGSADKHERANEAAPALALGAEGDAEGESAGSGPVEPPSSATEEPRQTRSSIAFVPLLVAAIIGGALVAVVGVLLARSGYFAPADTRGAELASEVSTLKDEVASLQQAKPADDVAPLRAEIDALKSQVGALAKNPPAAATDTGALNDLEARVGKLSDSVAALQSAPPSESGAAASAISDLSARIDTLSARVDAAPTQDALSALQAKLDAANGKLDAANSKIEDAAALAPAVAADALAAAVAEGRPFATELSAVKTLGVDSKSVDTLAAHADTGLPTLARLRSEFESEMAAIDLNEPVPEGAGMFDRLVQGARGLVTVRPAHPTAGSDPAAIVTRIRGALEVGDLKTALAEWATLPDAVKKATAAWAQQAEARSTADELVAQLRDQALSRLSAGR